MGVSLSLLFVGGTICTAVFPRGKAGLFPKASSKIAHLVKASSKSNLSNRPVSLLQKLRRPGQAVFHQILKRGTSKALPKATGALRLANMGAVRQIEQGQFLCIMLLDELEDLLHPLRKGALLLPRLGRGDMSAHGQPQRTQSGQNLVGIQGSFLLFQLGQMLQLPDCLLLLANVGAKMQKGKLATGCHIVHKSFSRAPGIKGQEGSREDKAVVMAISKAPDVVHHLLVDKDCFPCSYRKRPVQGAHLDVPGQQIKKLQIPVPVHYLKAGISGIGPVVDDVQDEVRKIRAAFQVDRLQILFLFQQQCPLR